MSELPSLSAQAGGIEYYRTKAQHKADCHQERCLGCLEPTFPKVEAVDHPAHYGGADNPYEAIKVIEAWELGFCLGNSVKYISRAGKKDPARAVEDLEKAKWYLEREIERRRAAQLPTA